MFRVNAFLLTGLLALAGCATKEEKRLSRAQQYVSQRTGLAPETREAILAGKVIMGMYPDEAHQAAGDFSYEVTGGPQDVLPLEVIKSQRRKPDEKVRIDLRFFNRTQYTTPEPVSFLVIFRNGKAVKILDQDQEAVDELRQQDEEQRLAEEQAEAIQMISGAYAPSGGSGSDPGAEIRTLAALLRQSESGYRLRDAAVATREMAGAAAALGKIGKPAVPAIIDALGDADPRVRAYACKAILYMGSAGQDAVPALIRELAGNNLAGFQEAAAALGRIGPAAHDAIPALTQGLRNEHLYIRRAARAALRRINPHGDLGDEPRDS